MFSGWRRRRRVRREAQLGMREERVQPPGSIGFWAEVSELRRAMQAKLKAGAGRRALIEAMQERAIRVDTVEAVPLETLEEALQRVPAGGQLRLSAEEYRKLMGKG